MGDRGAREWRQVQRLLEELKRPGKGAVAEYLYEELRRRCVGEWQNGGRGDLMEPRVYVASTYPLGRGMFGAGAGPWGWRVFRRPEDAPVAPQPALGSDADAGHESEGRPAVVQGEAETLEGAQVAADEALVSLGFILP